MIRKFENILIHKIVTLIADTGISSGIIGRVFWASSTDPVDPEVPPLTETAALVPVLVKAALRRSGRHTALIPCAIDQISRTLRTSSIDPIIPKGANAFLFLGVVNFIIQANYKDAASINIGISESASTLIILREESKIIVASLTNILNRNQSRQATTCPVENVLVNSLTWINSLATLLLGNILIPLRTSKTISIDREVPLLAITMSGLDIEYFMFATVVAFWFVTITDLHGRLTLLTPLRYHSYRQEQQQEHLLIHRYDFIKLKNIIGKQKI